MRQGQGDYGDAIGFDRELVGDVVEAAIRRTVNGQIHKVEEAVIELTHRHTQTHREVTSLKDSLAESAERWDAAADVTERISTLVRIAASRGARVIAILLAGLVGADAIARIFFS